MGFSIGRSQVLSTCESYRSAFARHDHWRVVRETRGAILTREAVDCSICKDPGKKTPLKFNMLHLIFSNPKKNPEMKLPSLKLTAKAPENGWLEDFLVSFWGV